MLKNESYFSLTLKHFGEKYICLELLMKSFIGTYSLVLLGFLRTDLIQSTGLISGRSDPSYIALTFELRGENETNKVQESSLSFDNSSRR